MEFLVPLFLALGAAALGLAAIGRVGAPAALWRPPAKVARILTAPAAAIRLNR
jgi:hypothetical protein